MKRGSKKSKSEVAPFTIVVGDGAETKEEQAKAAKATVASLKEKIRNLKTENGTFRPIKNVS